MTTSIPNSSTPPASAGASGAAAAAALLDAFAAAFANSGAGQTAATASPGGSFAAWLGAPVAANPAVTSTLNPVLGSRPAGRNLAQPPGASTSKLSQPLLPGANSWETSSPGQRPTESDSIGPAAGASAGVAAAGANGATAGAAVAVGSLPQIHPPAAANTGNFPDSIAAGHEGTGRVTAASTQSPAPAKADAAPSGPAKLSRDVVESLAAILAPVLQSLQSPVTAVATSGGEVVSKGPAPTAKTMVPAAGIASSQADEAAPGGTASASGASQIPASPAVAAPPLQVAIDFGDSRPVLKFELPALSPAAGQAMPSLADLRQAVAGALGTALKQAVGATSLSTFQLSTPIVTLRQLATPKRSNGAPTISISVEGRSATDSASTDVAPAAVLADTAANTDLAFAEVSMAKFADGTTRPDSVMPKVGFAPEKTFLVAPKEEVKDARAVAGISVAQSRSNMPANFTARRNSANLPDPVLPILLREAPVAATTVTPTPSRVENPSSAAPTLAHRAVETVLNVVEAQNNRPATDGVVNLHFKFGGEDLAVRVQLRGGEIHTQFNTDSPELRTALSNEWRAVTGSAGSEGLRLVAPTFSSSTPDQGFGSAPQGQFSSQQNSQQQPPPATPVFPSALRAASPDANAAHSDAGVAPRAPVYLPTSLHLAAVA